MLIGDCPCRLLALVRMLFELIFAVVKLDKGMKPVMVFAPPVVVFLLIPMPTAKFFIKFYFGEILSPVAETPSWLE